MDDLDDETDNERTYGSTPRSQKKLSWEDERSKHTPLRYDSSDTSPERCSQPKLKSIIVRPPSPAVKNRRSAPDDGDSHRKPKLKALDVRRYDGKRSIDEYLTQFEVISRHNQWSKQEQAAALLSSLDGAACSIINEIEDVEEATYKSVKDALLRRFGATKRTEVHERALDEIRMKPGEDIKQVAMEIVKLSKRAYPELSAAQRERFAVKSLIEAIDDHEKAFYIRDKEAKTISEVCELFEKYEALRRPEHRKQKPVTVRSATANSQPNDSPDLGKWMKDADSKIQQLTDAVSKLVNKELDRPTTTTKPEVKQTTTDNGGVPRKPCPRCGGPHWARNCPNSNSNDNRSKPSTGCFNCGQHGHYARQCPSGNESRPTSAPDRRSEASQSQ